MKKKMVVGVVVVGLLVGVGYGYFFKEAEKKSEAPIEKKHKVNDKINERVKYEIDNGIFKSHYKEAYEIVKKMTVEEKIAQLLLVRYPDENQKEILEQYQFGGYLFFAKDFKGKTKDEVISMTNMVQEVAKIPILTALDEEGGIVVRVSSNPNLRGSKFLSSQELYRQGGFDKIREDTIEKSSLLNSLGLNLNLAPVVDVSTNSSDYMYKRSLGQNAQITSEFTKIVIETSKNTGVSYTLKHFPGYGNNVDTHNGSSRDNRSLESLHEIDLKPFDAGIKSGAEAVLVSHNIVTAIDSENPASLSSSINQLLREELGFTGVVIVDDLVMGAVKDIPDKSLKSFMAGNDLFITTNYLESIGEIKGGIDRGEITEEDLDKHVIRILSWKYEKGLLK